MSMVIQVVQHLSPGGIETMALDLNSFCAQHEKTLIVSLEGDLKSALNNWPRLHTVEKNLIFLNKKPGLKPALILRLSQLFKHLQADVVHTHHIGPLLYAGLAARLAGVRQLIHTEHDAWHLNRLRRRTLQQQVIRITRPLLIADADTVAKAMQSFLNIKNIQVVHNGIDTEIFTPGDQHIARQRLGLPSGVKLIGCSGRLETVKGHQVLINALSKLPENIHLALAGSGSIAPRLHRLVEALSLDSRVHFLGHIDEMPTFYQSLDLFCLPSLNEGMPLSPLEAQACNIPCAVTDVGGAHEALCPHSGELIPAENTKAMASTLLKMLEQPQNIKPRTFVQRHGDVRLMANAYASLRHTGV